MPQIRGTAVLALIAIVVLASVIGLIVSKGCGERVPPVPPVPPIVEPTPAQLKLKSDAYALEQNGKWCESRNAWDELLSTLKGVPTGAEYQLLNALRVEAERNQRLTKSHCQPSAPPKGPVKLPPKNPPPQNIPEDVFAAIYKPGRTIRSLALLNLSGSGVNDSWLLHGEVRFAYQYRVVIETRVKEAYGQRLVFEQRYLDVSEHRIVSKETLEMNAPESPVIVAIWQPLEDRFLKILPTYRAAKTAGQMMQILDPGLKNTLTFLKGWSPDKDPMQIDYLAKTDDLAGAHLEIEYISGLGVTSVKVLDGNRLDHLLLEDLGYNASLMVDYFVGRAADRTDGGIEELRVQDIGGMLAMRYDLSATGVIKARRKTAQGERQAEIAIIGGDVRLHGTINGQEHGSHIFPKNGLMEYSLPERLVTHAKATWEGEFDWSSRDHLLFGTKNIRNVVCESYYEASKVNP